MLNRKQQIKQKTRVDKITCSFKVECPNKRTCSRSKSIESTGCSNSKDMQDASLVLLPSVGQSRRDSTLKNSTGKKPLIDEKVTSHRYQKWIPVISKTGKPLMPCHPARARQLMDNKKAIPKWKVGIYYIQLTERSDGVTQVVAVGIDPGSKREAFTVKSKEHTYLNILSNAVTYIKESMEVRRSARRNRRNRNVKYRKNRWNRLPSGFAPSTNARWTLKLRIVNILIKIYPISDIAVENINNNSKKDNSSWNKNFSPLKIGKKKFYASLKKIAKLHLFLGYETATGRDNLGLIKTYSKLKEIFTTHNVDSWVLANFITNCNGIIDNRDIFRLIPLRFHRRQLHVLQFTKGGIRKKYGGTLSLGLKRGSLAKHKRHGLCYIGGNMNGKVSIHMLENGIRWDKKIKIEDLKILRYNVWRYKTIFN